jgi:hypothetical protein
MVVGRLYPIAADECPQRILEPKKIGANLYHPLSASEAKSHWLLNCKVFPVGNQLNSQGGLQANSGENDKSIEIDGPDHLVWVHKSWDGKLRDGGLVFFRNLVAYGCQLSSANGFIAKKFGVPDGDGSTQHKGKLNRGGFTHLGKSSCHSAWVLSSLLRKRSRSRTKRSITDP